MAKPTTYPYTAWVLQPSFKPKEVTFVERALAYGIEDYGCVSEAGKWYRRDQIHATKTDAIIFGHSEVRRMQDDLKKKLDSLEKKRDALAKAAG